MSYEKSLKTIKRADLEDYFSKVKGRSFKIPKNKKELKRFDTLGKILGIGIASLVHCFDPDVFILGGKISNFFKYFQKSMNAIVKKKCMFKPCKIVKQKLGDDAGVLGAVLLHRENTR